LSEIEEFCEEAHSVAREHGWWDKNRDHKEAILMIITELCEGVQKDRAGDNDGFEEEIVDVWIRLADLTGYLNFDIEEGIRKKMEYNKTRPYRHNRKY